MEIQPTNFTVKMIEWLIYIGSVICIKINFHSFILRYLKAGTLGLEDMVLDISWKFSLKDFFSAHIIPVYLLLISFKSAGRASDP